MDALVLNHQLVWNRRWCEYDFCFSLVPFDTFFVLNPLKGKRHSSKNRQSKARRLEWRKFWSYYNYRRMKLRIAVKQQTLIHNHANANSFLCGTVTTNVKIQIAWNCYRLQPWMLIKARAKRILVLKSLN